MFGLRMLILSFLMSVSGLTAQSEPSSRADEIKEKIIKNLSKNLRAPSQVQPLLILIGGYVSSGKTTFATAIEREYGMTVFSLNSIRQAMLDEGIDIRSNKKEERQILFDIYPRLLAPCVANRQHIVIDSNANRQGIQDALRFFEEHPGGKSYIVVKIHLQASEEELYRRVRERIQRPGLHQGTESDLAYELNTPSKAIYPEDYDLVINTEHTSFNNEMQIFRDYLASYFEDFEL